jgi:hypothetical protein
MFDLLGIACGEPGSPQGDRALKLWNSWSKRTNSPPTIHMWITRGTVGALSELLLPPGSSEAPELHIHVIWFLGLNL